MEESAAWPELSEPARHLMARIHSDEPLDEPVRDLVAALDRLSHADVEALCEAIGRRVQGARAAGSASASQGTESAA